LLLHAHLLNLAVFDKRLIPLEMRFGLFVGTESLASVWWYAHAAKMKFLRVSLVHPENPEILSKRFTGLQDFQN